ncbi:heterochromatin protein 1-like [Chelonus insularis]|uniref:heterochromatin protein 1-like n=1 Tax=Chelonus insularis TaxID=460826 RepID=UPI00158D3779|nr:heterochromatin protein 1-like [Chelonus insularis]
MRRIMKGKRRKSDSPSDAESEENGDNAHKTEVTGDEAKPDDDNGENAVKSKRKTPRGRESKAAEENAETETKQGDEVDVNSSDTSSRHENGNVTKSAGDKRRKKEDRKATTSQEKEDSSQEYEVEKIVSRRTIKGRRQFLVRWKGYDESSDTWENEKDLNCPQLIEDFLVDEEMQQNQVTQNSEEKPGKSAKTKSPRAAKRKRKSKTVKKNGDDKSEANDDGTDEKANSTEKKPKKTRLSKHNNDNDVKVDDSEEESSKEFEVEKIIDVHFKKNKSREFLIRWKGFKPSDDTWEPESNLNCPDLISKFMDKVEKAKTTDLRELRTNPSHTKRYTLSMYDRQRRLSRRNMGKERATYHQCD